MGEKSKLFHQYNATNKLKEMMELENYHSGTIIVIIDSGLNHLRMLT